jgi:hypothetical protein
LELVQRFREKGAVSPNKAMTVQELGLPPRSRKLKSGAWENQAYIRRGQRQVLLF